MFSKLIFVLLGWFVFVSTTPIITYNNAQFNVTNAHFQISIIFPIPTQNMCICQCYMNPLCITGTFCGINQTCVLFYVHLQQGQLSLMTTNNINSVFTFPDKTNPFISFHLCTSSTYAATCSSINFSNTTCIISGRCKNTAGNWISSNITLKSGFGNGCALANSNGVLECAGFCD